MGGLSPQTENRIRYPPYQEDHHIVLLDEVTAARIAATPNSPYADYDPMETEIEAALYGAGYIISDFPSLYDMFGKFMAGLDVDALFDQIFADSTSGAIISNLISEHAGTLSDDLENDALPRFVTGLRDINSVMSSTFVVGKAMMETQREKEVSKFAAQTKYNMIPVAVDRWKKHLDWNEDVIKRYLEVMKQAVNTQTEVRDHDMSVAAADTLWPLSLLINYEAKAVGAISNAVTETESIPVWKEIVGAAGTVIGGALIPGAGGLGGIMSTLFQGLF